MATVKNGIAGILYLTRAPKIGVEIPIIAKRIKVKSKQNTIKFVE